MEDKFDSMLDEITEREGIRRAIITDLEQATGAVVILRDPCGVVNVHWIGLDTFMALSMQHYVETVRCAALDVVDVKDGEDDGGD